MAKCLFLKDGCVQSFKMTARQSCYLQPVYFPVGVVGIYLSKVAVSLCRRWRQKRSVARNSALWYFRMEYEYEKVFRKIFSRIPCRRLCVNANVIICQIKNCRLFFNSLTRILIDGIQMIRIKFKEEEPSHYFLKKENCQDNVIFC